MILMYRRWQHIAQCQAGLDQQGIRVLAHQRAFATSGRCYVILSRQRGSGGWNATIGTDGRQGVGDTDGEVRYEDPNTR